MRRRRVTVRRGPGLLGTLAIGGTGIAMLKHRRTGSDGLRYRCRGEPCRSGESSMPRILIVEDHDVLRGVLLDLLSPDDLEDAHRAKGRQHGDEAQEHLQ